MDWDNGKGRAGWERETWDIGGGGCGARQADAPLGARGLDLLPRLLLRLWYGWAQENSPEVKPKVL